MSNNIYTGAAEYGRFTSTIGMFIGIFIGSIMFIIGLYLLFKKQDKYESTIGIISSSPNCVINRNNMYNCNAQVIYTLNNKTNTKLFFFSDLQEQLLSGSSVDLYYKLSDPINTITNIKQTNSKVIAVLLFITSIIIILGSWYSYYVAKKYKFAAAGEGFGAVINTFNR